MCPSTPSPLSIFSLAFITKVVYVLHIYLATVSLSPQECKLLEGSGFCFVH